MRLFNVLVVVFPIRVENAVLIFLGESDAHVAVVVPDAKGVCFPRNMHKATIRRKIVEAAGRTKVFFALRHIEGGQPETFVLEKWTMVEE